MRRRLAIGTLLLLLVAATAAAAGLQDEPDSLRAVLGIGSKRGTLVELSGAGVAEFRLYTEPKRSRIGWWSEGTLYLYDVHGDEHEQRAAALLSALGSGSLLTFTASRLPKARHGSSPVAKVEAMQIAVTLDTGPRLR